MVDCKSIYGKVKSHPLKYSLKNYLNNGGLFFVAGNTINLILIENLQAPHEQCLARSEDKMCVYI